MEVHNRNYSRIVTGDEVRRDYRLAGEGFLTDEALAYETGWLANDSIDYQHHYRIVRFRIMEAAKKLVRSAFDFSSINQGAEFGSGVRGWLQNFYLPEGLDWRQFDINPQAVEHNREFSQSLGRTPRVDVGSMYDMPLSDASVDVIAGLSSWDGIVFQEIAAEETKRCLRPGGHFVHFQDLQPGEPALLMRESAKRLAMGASPDIPCEYEEKLFIVNNRLYDRGVFLRSFDSIEYGPIGVNDYLTAYMAQVLENSGFGLEQAGRVRANARSTKNEISERAMMLMGVPSDVGQNNRFSYENGALVDWGHDPKIPDGEVREDVMMHVVIAEKR
ncbi:MAG: methyltransferase domain-containing protein [Candidatus Aenigmatarchaeota archaeon]